MVVHPIEGCSSSSEGTYTGCALRETALGDDANSKLQLRSGRSFASLFQPPSAGEFDSKEVYFVHHSNIPSEVTAARALICTQAEPLRFEALQRELVTSPPGPQLLGVPRPPPSWPEGSRAVASPGSGPPSALQGTAPKRGNFRDRGCSQANQRTAVAARPARKDAVNNAIATPHWSKSRPQSRSPGHLLLLLDES